MFFGCLPCCGGGGVSDCCDARRALWLSKLQATGHGSFYRLVMTSGLNSPTLDTDNLSGTVTAGSGVSFSTSAYLSASYVVGNGTSLFIVLQDLIGSGALGSKRLDFTATCYGTSATASAYYAATATSLTFDNGVDPLETISTNPSGSPNSVGPLVRLYEENEKSYRSGTWTAQYSDGTQASVTVYASGLFVPFDSDCLPVA